MKYSKKYKKRVKRIRSSLKKKNNLVKTKNKKNSNYLRKTRKQKGGFNFNSFVWSVQDFGSNFLNTLSGNTIQASSNPTMDNFEI